MWEIGIIGKWGRLVSFVDIIIIGNGFWDMLWWLWGFGLFFVVVWYRVVWMWWLGIYIGLFRLRWSRGSGDGNIFGLGEDLEVGVVDFFFFDWDIGMRVGMFLWIIEWNLGLLLVLVFFLVLEFFVLFLVGVDFFSCCFLVFFFFSGGMMDFVDGFFLMLLYVWVSMVNGFFFVLSWKWK